MCIPLFIVTASDLTWQGSGKVKGLFKKLWILGKIYDTHTHHLSRGGAAR